MPYPCDPIELIEAKDRRRLPLVVEVCREYRPIAAALLCEIDYVTGRKLTWLYRDRVGEIVDQTRLKRMFGDGDEIRINIGLRADFGKYVAEQNTEFQIVKSDAIPGSIERFRTIMEFFPLWTLHDPGRRANHDRILAEGDPGSSLRGFGELIVDPRMTYPRITNLIDIWDPPRECPSTYRSENEGLASLLKDRLDLRGPSSIYRDCALWLCGYPGTLCDDKALMGLVEMAQELCIRFWQPEERQRLAGRRKRALRTMLDAGDYHYKRSGPEPWMTERQIEYAHAREACRFVFEDALLPVTFQINMDSLVCMIPLDGDHVDMTTLSVAYLGDDDSSSMSPPTPLRHLPAS